MKSPLHLFNTASRSKELFQSSVEEGMVGMYCCGPTVYNHAHIGNLRTYVFEDVLKRALTAAGCTVKHVVNITDVGHLISDADTGEDKMEKGAEREGKTVWEIAENYTQRFIRDIQDLNILQPDVWPKATDHIPEMIALVKALEERGYTYTTGDGIYFDTTRFDRYCDFARLDPESLRAGSRVDMGEKKSPTDFALWKFSPAGVKRQMEWDSPWGMGFPGWHIECSAMSLKYLAQPIDIHCGGADHIRVHHTNEIAQAEAATGKKFVRFWLHGEFLNMVDAKMAKSGDNFVTLATVKERGFEPLAYRMFCFTAHYRSPLGFSWEGLDAAAQSLKNLRKLARTEAGGTSSEKETPATELLESFFQAVFDDLNMPRAVAAAWELLRRKDASAGAKRACVEQMDSILGLDLFTGSQEALATRTDETGTVRIVMTPQTEKLDVDGVFAIVHARREARKHKDFALADRLRDELAEMGIRISDMPDGTTECIATI